MPDDNFLAERGRALEEDYFRKKDRELIEKLQQTAADAGVRQEMGRRTGLLDAERLDQLQALGFTPDTVGLLPLIPVVQMAWAEGGVTDAERTLLVRIARARGISEGSVADRQLTAWMTTCPDDAMFAGAAGLIRATLAAGAQPDGLSAEDLVEQCEAIARASGGIFGIGRISAEERTLLSAIAAELGARAP